MYEIELKARVKDRQKIIPLINSFAVFKGTLVKNDVYYHFKKSPEQKAISLQNQNAEKPYITCRLRHEQITAPDGTKKTADLLTYKSKEMHTYSNGTACEVNQENETELSDSKTVEKLLLDTGFEPAYTKTKDVMQWETQTPFGKALLELCKVEKLGDFLEIEIIAENCYNEKAINEELKSLLLKSGLQTSDIEDKYYCELLAEAAVMQTKTTDSHADKIKS